MRPNEWSLRQQETVKARSEQGHGGESNDDGEYTAGQ